MSEQPILGSLAWMTYTMRSVHPVYDVGQQVTILSNDSSSGTYLTADDAVTVLTADNVVTTNNLIRWI